MATKNTNKTINNENEECQEDDEVLEDENLLVTGIMEITTNKTVDKEIK